MCKKRVPDPRLLVGSENTKERTEDWKVQAQGPEKMDCVWPRTIQNDEVCNDVIEVVGISSGSSVA